MDTDRDVLFGILAYQSGAIDARQFQEAYAAWSRNRATPLAEVLESLGWIDAGQRARLDSQLDFKLSDSVAQAASLADRFEFNRLPESITETLAGPSRTASAAETETLAATQADAPAGPSSSNLAETVDQESALLAKTEVAQPTVAFLSGSDAGSKASGPTVASGPGHALVAPLGDRAEGAEKYTRTHLHAKGGIGQVWLARDDTLGREVALKELRPDRSHDGVVWARFFEEARITGQLEHPGIVPIYELSRGPEAGQAPFYTMRFVRGRTLSEVVKEYHEKRRAGQAGPLELAAILNAFVSVCQAVAYAHSRGVLHRDLKGQNVVLGDFGEVMVLDWGLAKLIGQQESSGEGDAPPEPIASPEHPIEETQQGQVLGTPAYMAPEQARGLIDQIDRRTDIYALGAVLYEILTGEPPFRASSLTAVLHKVVTEPPVRPRTLNPAVPAPLEAVCLKAMAKPREERYQEAGDLARDVQRWLADEPVLAYPEPWTQRARRWARRHRSAVAAAGLIALFGVAALGVTTVVVRNERNQARLQRQIARQAVDEMYTDVAEQWLEDRSDPLQRKFLDRALAYCELFVKQDASDPAAIQEKGRAYQRLGDILRKLGRQDEATRAYQQAISILQTLSQNEPGQPDHRHHLARSWAHLGAAQFDQGAYAQADHDYREAFALQEPLAASNPDRPPYQLDLARTLKLQGDLHRMTGRLETAEKSYRDALAIEERLRTRYPNDVTYQLDLAVLEDALGLLLAELGKPSEAARAHGAAIALQEPLVAATPTSPALRYALAKSYNSLALLERRTGDPRVQEDLLKKELKLVQRLAEDFPDRPEYRRSLARCRINLAELHQRQRRPREALPHLAEAIALNQALATEAPGIVQYRIDLAKARNNLAGVLAGSGDLVEAEKLFAVVQQDYEKLAREIPDAPRHKQQLARALSNRGDLLRMLGRADEADRQFTRSIDLLQELTDSFPANHEYQGDLARSLEGRGLVLAGLKRPADAEQAYQKSVALRERLLAEEATADHRKALAATLTNLGNLRRTSAPAALQRAVDLFGEIVKDAPDSGPDRLYLARAQDSLAEFEAARGQHDAALAHYAEAARNTRTVLARSSGDVNARTQLGHILGMQAGSQQKLGQLAAARSSYEQAIAEQRQVLKESPRSARALLPLIRGNLVGLAAVLRESGETASAALVAQELGKLEPNRPESLAAAARLLAQCAASIESDGTPSSSDIDPTTAARSYSEQAVALLKQVLDLGAVNLIPEASDRDFAALANREDFQALTSRKTPKPSASEPAGSSAKE